MGDDRPYLTFGEFAALAGNGDAGWWRLEVLEYAVFRNPWVGTRRDLVATVDGRRAQSLRRLAKRERDPERVGKMQELAEQYEKPRTPNAARQHAKRALTWLAERRLISYTGSPEGVRIRPGTGIEFRRLKKTPSRIYLPPEVLAGLRGGYKNEEKCTHPVGTKTTKNVPTKRVQKPRKVYPPKPKNVPTDVPTDVPTPKGSPDLRPVRPVSVGSKLPPEARGADPAPPVVPSKVLTPRDPSELHTLGDFTAYLATSRPTNDADVWLGSVGVPPYPGVEVHRAVVHVPGPPRVAPDSTPAERVRLLHAAYRSAVRGAYVRANADWTPPKRFWRPMPKPPKDGAEPTAAASRFLDCAAQFLEHNLPPHVWCMHRIESWLKTANVALDKPPPIKYVFDPALIRKQRGWVRGLADSIAIARDETAPKAKEILRQWERMKREFFHRRVASEAQAQDVAAGFFPPGEFESALDAARVEAADMTEMYRDRIAEGDWVW